jgi:hypothetical protein
MLRRELDTDPGLTTDHDRVPVVVGVDRSAEHAGPEAALRVQIRGIEHDDLSGDLHCVMLSRRADNDPARITR